MHQTCVFTWRTRKRLPQLFRLAHVCVSIIRTCARVGKDGTPRRLARIGFRGQSVCIVYLKIPISKNTPHTY